MGRQLILAFALLSACLLVRAESVAVPAELWDQPRSGAIILAQPVFKRSVAALLSNPETRLHIRFGRGEEALLQAEELRAWLIALAVDAKRVELIADSENSRGLSLELIGTTVKTEIPTNPKRNP